MGQKVSNGAKSKEGVLDKVAGVLGTGDQWSSFKGSMTALASLPNIIVTYLKWVAIGGAVLAVVFLGVFIWRFSRGNAPDVGSAVGTLARLTPQGRLLSAVM
jgi:hypothetical protein